MTIGLNMNTLTCWRASFREKASQATSFGGTTLKADPRHLLGGVYANRVIDYPLISIGSRDPIGIRLHAHENEDPTQWNWEMTPPSELG